MQLKNSRERFGALAKFFHWTSAAAFIGAYIVVYYVIWFLDDEAPGTLAVLNVHWMLGLLVGALVLPRLAWRLFDVQPQDPPGSVLEHRLAHAAHWGLYGLLIVLPLTGYAGTSLPTDFGLFSVPSFRDTALFDALASIFGFGWESFEPPVDAVHHFLGKWVAWGVVGLHVLAAVYHHRVRKDDVLTRMLPCGRSRNS
ncbi:cytochrome b [Janthinobacterium sp. RB2R34]|uniref:cytochrome b n=1 Tax=Janthinobacterium sp. RB2R34 TaxID=3424193 RepID=UPI003F299326